jgi:hypothetical protein
MCDNFFDSGEVVKFCERNSFLSICDAQCKRFGTQRCNPLEGMDTWAAPRPPLSQRVWEDSQKQFPVVDKGKERLVEKQKKDIAKWQKNEEKLRLQMEKKCADVEDKNHQKKTSTPPEAPTTFQGKVKARALKYLNGLKKKKQY